MKRKIISAMSILLMLCVMVVNVSALEEPDMSRTGSISITMTYQGQSVAGGSLTLYRVADVHEENGADYSFVLTEDYAGSQVSLDALGDSGTAQALADYAVQNNLAGTEKTIGKDGIVVFAELEPGLYLLVQQVPAEGYMAVSPFLVSVPAYKDGSYIYDVDGSPKLALEQAPTDPPPTTEPPPPQIPQTGLNQWPVPVLAISGLLLVMLGLVLYTAGKKKSHES